MQFFIEYGLFLAKVATFCIAIMLVVGAMVATAMRQRQTSGHLEVTCLNKQYDEMERTLNSALLSSQQFKQKLKTEKKANKVKAKAEKKANKKVEKNTDEASKAKADKSSVPTKAADGTATDGKRVYVLDFDGDLRASEVASLRQEISAILTMAQSCDEVVVRLESPGGAVHGYGLAASQLQRLRERNIPLTVCVDKVAASGGYMMACVAERIIAAPFAIIGSIGVLAQIPNLHRLLKKHDIDFEQLSAGEYKRTLTWFGENTDQARKKMQQELAEVHDLFKQHVKTQRPDLDIDKIATGEHWLGSRALELGLVDKLQTSDDYLMALRNDAQLIELQYIEKKKFIDRLAFLARTYSSRNSLTDRIGQPLLM